MPIVYVNPAGRRRRRRRNPPFGASNSSYASGMKAWSAKQSAAATPSKKAKKSPKKRRKLYGAAAAAHAKKVGRKKKSTKRRSAAKTSAGRTRGMAKPKRKSAGKSRGKRKSRKKKSTAASYHTGARGYGAGMAAWSAKQATKKKRKKRKSSGKGKRSHASYVAAGKKAARTRKRNKAKRSAAAKKSRRKGGKRKARKSSSRKRSSGKRKARRSKSRRRWRERRAGGPRRRRGVKALRKARWLIKRSRVGLNGPRARAYSRKHRMRSNPSALLRQLTDTVKVAIPVAASLYLSRIVANEVGKRAPDQLAKLKQFGPPTVAALTVVGAHFATRRGPLAKYRAGILMGTGINLVDRLIGAFAPQNVKDMFGLSGADGLYDSALSEYMQPTGEYTDGLADYLGTGDVSEELGALQDEDGFGQLSAGSMSGNVFGGNGNGEGSSLYTGVFSKDR